MAAEGPRLCVVGLTGGLASGKSTVARSLAARGVPCLDADRIVHRLYAAGGAGAAAVRDLFGQAMLTEDGSVDRQELARRVLAEPAARVALERAVHPLVRREVAVWLEQLAGSAEPPEAAVVEAALLVETGAASSYDLLVVVWCRPEQQIERAVARGVPEARARALLAAQAPLDAKRAVADVVVDNAGPESALATEVERAWQEILRRCRTRPRHGADGGEAEGQPAGGSSHSV